MADDNTEISRRSALERVGGLTAGLLGAGAFAGSAGASETTGERATDATAADVGARGPTAVDGQVPAGSAGGTLSRCRTAGGSAWRFELEFTQCDGYIEASISLFGVISDTWRLTEDELVKKQTFPIGLDLQPSLSEEITLEVRADRDLEEVDVTVTYCEYDYSSLEWNCSTLGSYHHEF